MKQCEILEKIEETACLLYQNKAHQGLEMTAELLDILTVLLKSETVDIETKRQMIDCLRELLPAYEKKNILALADCMEGKVKTLITDNIWE